MDNQTKINYYWNQFVEEGKLNALSKIYFAYYDFLFDYGLRLTRNIQAVEDTIQNMFVNFLNTRERIGEVKNLSGYLVSIFRRTYLKSLKLIIKYLETTHRTICNLIFSKVWRIAKSMIR